MKPEEIFIYRDIQKNTEMAIKAIDTLSDKVYEDDFALQISRQSLKYSDIRVLTVDKEGQLENISYTGEEGKISFPVTHTGDYMFLSVSDSKVYGQTKVNGGQAVIERNKDFGIE